MNQKIGSGVEIHHDGLHDPGREQAIEASNFSQEIDGEDDPSEEIAEQSHVNYCIKKGRFGSMPSCILDCLPESIIQDILSRLSIRDLYIARQSCIAWHRTVSFCQNFRELYDERNHESWIALTSSSRLNPDGFILFNTNDAKLSCFVPPTQHLDDHRMTPGWLLQGVTDGLMLLVSREGRLGVVNPLTRHLRLLPEAKVSSRLRLESCLRKKLWYDQLPSISINIVGDLASKTFKVMVLGELRSRQVHSLIYRSETNTWTIKLCSEIDYKLFRLLSHSTADGNTIYFISTVQRRRSYPRLMVSYNTETHLFVVENMDIIEILGIEGIYWTQIIGIVVYKGKIFLLSVGNRPALNPLCIVGLWEANLGYLKWKLLATTDLDWVNKKAIAFQLFEAAIAYDGKQRVNIIARSGSSAILMELNLDSKEWKILDGNVNVADIAARSKRASEEDSINKAFKAFHINLKFCTAI